MENCIVCLKSDEDILTRITTASTEWTKNEMQKVIEKHLWWWYLKTSTSNKFVPWVCGQCWQEISSFHDFYKKIENAHKLSQLDASLMSLVKKEEVVLINAKPDSIKDMDTDLLFINDKPEGKPRNQNNFEAAFIDIGEIDAEYDLSSYCDVSLREDNVDLNNSDKSPSSNDMKIANVNQHKKSKLREKQNIYRNERLNNKTKSSTVQKALKCKTYQVDKFFEENQHNLECSICNLRLSDFRSIKAHYRNEHNIKGYALCCGKKFYRRFLLVDHLKVHKDPNVFKCESCKKIFETRRGMEMHIYTHKNRERKYNCDDCGKSYFNVKIFQRHKLTHVPDIEKTISCSQCNKKFASDDLRKRHEDSTHSRKNAKICDVCGKSFTFLYSFLRHMEEHAGIPKTLVTCDICGVQLTSKYGLTQHMKMRHVKENMQEQTCPHCSKVSPNLNAHRKHIKYSHTMQRNHVCHLCEKAFRRPVELKEHLSTHTGEALYTCPHCPRTFISNANMHKHRKVVHRKEWEESRSTKLNRTRNKTLLIPTKTASDKEFVQNYVKNSTSVITDPFINAFSLYMENKDNLT